MNQLDRTPPPLLNTNTFSPNGNRSLELGAVHLIRRMYESPYHNEVAFRTREQMHLAPGQCVIDIGSSYCPDLTEIDTALSGDGTVFLSDTSEVALAQRVDTVRCKVIPILGDCSKINLPDNAVQACRAIRSLQHTHSPTQAVEEMLRITSLGGRIVIVEPEWKAKKIVSDSSGIDLNAYIAEQVSEIKHADLSERLPELLLHKGCSNLSVESFSLVASTPQEIEFYGQFEQRISGSSMDESHRTQLLSEYYDALRKKTTALHLTLKMISATHTYK